MEVVRQSVAIFDRFHLHAQVLAASIRNPPHVIQAALAGAHVATIPYSVLQAMLKHPLTDLGIERFLADSRKYAAV
jgi:transaldolase